MKVTHLSGSLTRNAGGIFEIELALARHLQALGVHNEALGLDDEWWAEDQARWAPVPARVFPVRGPRAFGYAAGLGEALHSSGCDLAHLHSMWMYPSVVVSSWSGGKRPYIVTPNGMLEPWALRNAAWKKKIAGALYERRMLAGAPCLHANTEKELNDIRAFGLHNPVAIIPNGIELPEEGAEGLKVEGRRSAERKILLFLGRLHPKKGLVNGLRAWAEARAEGWQLAVAGWDQGGHSAELRKLCAELGVTVADVPAAEFVARGAAEPVVFLGPTFGGTKDELLRLASAFFLPSFSEGLPMSVLEAWSYRLPVLMTDHCNIPEGFAAQAAIHIDTAPQSITAGIHQLVGLSDAERLAMGQRGRQLVEERFTWRHVASQLRDVYQWILGGGSPPETIRR